ncbi:unnamed protein product [Fraxinus pennsylvanica]|uniref:Uncharacterized protein n=1 Tax=Fraxinus pennsylvanica TaxID=56036 RepID=A0AAD2AJS7_9LAMI|nr:unnamed protein product [Fraxinus pennsylvanica]
MEFIQNLLLLLVLFLSLLLSYSSSIHELLQSRGLPAGLLPKEVRSYTLSESGLLEVFLDGLCMIKFDTMAFYDSVVRANFTYGSLTGVEGFSLEELFFWLPVKDIVVDYPKPGLILFDIGVARKQLSLSLFEDPPDYNDSLDSKPLEWSHEKQPNTTIIIDRFMSFLVLLQRTPPRGGDGGQVAHEIYRHRPPLREADLQETPCNSEIFVVRRRVECKDGACHSQH